METKKRSIVKAVIWRIIGIVLLSAVTYIVTGSWKVMTAVTVFFESIHTVLYYFHERLWSRISWGRIKHPLESIKVQKELAPEDKKVLEDKLRELGYM